MFKNTASQKFTVIAFADAGHATLDAGEVVTGDAANITCKVEQDDDGTQSATNDVNPTEVEDGQYRFDLTQAETNGDKLTFYPESSTAGVQVVGMPSNVIYTRPPNFSDMGIETDGHVHGDVKQIEGVDATDQINAACDASIETYNLDHLMAAAVTGTDVVDDSVIAQMTSKSATADWDTFDNTTDSLEALRDNQASGAKTIMVGPLMVVADAVADTLRIYLTVVDEDGSPVDLDAVPTSTIIDATDGSACNASVGTSIKVAATTGEYYVPVTRTANVEACMIEVNGTRSGANPAPLQIQLRLTETPAQIFAQGHSIQVHDNINGLEVDLADTQTIRLGICVTDAMGDLPTAAEITPGTMSISRKAIGGGSWTIIENNTACNEDDGEIYLEEVFDSGTGYAEGDSLLIQMKSQKVTIGGVDHEIFGPNGCRFYARIRQTMRGTDSAATATALATAQADLDIITGADGVNLLSATQASIDAIEADTNELQGDWVDGGRLDLILDARMPTSHIAATGGAVDTVTTLTNLPAITANWLTATGIQDNAFTDAKFAAATEPAQGAPPVSASIATEIRYLYKNWRNKKTETATQYSLYADDTTTIDHKATTSDDGTTVTKEEMTTGA